MVKFSGQLSIYDVFLKNKKVQVVTPSFEKELKAFQETKSGKDKNKLIEGMTLFARGWISDEFQVELNIPICINNKLTSTAGNFKYKVEKVVVNGRCSSNESIAREITLAGFLVEHNNYSTVENTLKHELIHYALHEMGSPFSDGDFEFKSACHGRNVMLKHNALMPLYTFVCACGFNHKSSRRLNKNRVYRCRTCGTKIVFSKEKQLCRYVEN